MMENNSETKYYDKSGKVVRRVFKIPVGDLNMDDAEKYIRSLLDKYKAPNPDVDYWFPVKDENFKGYEWIPEEQLTDQERQDYDHLRFGDTKEEDYSNLDYHHITREEIWNELTTRERIERLTGKDSLEGCGFVDWNQFDLDFLANYLEDEYRYNSSGEAFAIFKLIEFYRAHKDNLK